MEADESNFKTALLFCCHIISCIRITQIAIIGRTRWQRNKVTYVCTSAIKGEQVLRLFMYCI